MTFEQLRRAAPNAVRPRAAAVRLPHNPPMHRTGPAVSFLSTERGPAPARPVIGNPLSASMASRPSTLVAVPDALREFMADVSDRIRAEDDSATTASDDLLQCEQGYGGLSDDGLFDFVFFPSKQDRWEFRLLADEIDEIGSGHRTEVRVRINDDESPPVDPWLLNNLDLRQGLAKLESIGVTGLSENSSHADVVAMLGEPGAQGGNEPPPGRRHPEPWIKYWLPQCQAHFSFFRSGKLRRIAFMPRDWQPGM